MNNLPNKFRPQAKDKLSIIKHRRRGMVETYNWQSRVEWFPAGYKLNKQTIARQFRRLHYLACHAPESITKQWKKAYINFYKQHFGVYYKHNGVQGSVRYLNKWSCHSWL